MGAAAHPGVVCVIIAAKNARATIARAVSSALAEVAVGEVVVVDDGSTDDTAALARSVDDGTDRLQVLHLPRNLGPAAARNRGIRASSAPYITVLDADDYWLPGRLQTLLAEMKDHDFVADDLLRVVEGREDEPPATLTGGALTLPADISLADFALANVSRKGRDRQELGFLKPVMRRAFLQDHNLAYDETLRLGEDYVLYAQALARGARFRLIPACGYVAVERAASISGSHGAAELGPYAKASRALLDEPGLSPKERAALAGHARQVRSKLHFQKVLAVRRRRGMAPALGVMIGDPLGAAYVLSQALAARLARWRTRRSMAEAAY
ncbi:MAG TPA: glycosyltransferase family 2 protein [Caulobacteraceae bacterium]|jgi:succinoglycan biosynthesis protein ExoU